MPMLLNDLMSGSKKEGSPSGCPLCDGNEGMIQFNWQIARTQPESEFAPYASSLSRKSNLKWGTLHFCPTCGRAWYLDGLQEKMTLVPKEKETLLTEWSSSPLYLTPELWAKAKAIGATPAHVFSGDKYFAEVPCRVVTREGETLDKCLLTFKTAPPLENYQSKVRFLKDVADILPSDFALPASIRAATSRSQQEKTGRAPTRVTSPEGREFCLNWTVNFFDTKGFRGKDARLATQKLKPKGGRIRVINEPIDDITFFIGDWSEKTRELFVPQ
jgi:hypothetical protein